jgi:hypothetical protein
MIMPKVTIQFLDLKVTIEDEKTPYDELLATASTELVCLMQEQTVKDTLNRIFEKHNGDDDGTDPDGQLPPKEEHGMFQ